MATDNFSGIQLKQWNSVVDATYGISNNILAIDPVNNFENSVIYSVYVPARAVKNMAGNLLAAPYNFSFQTETVLAGISLDAPEYTLPVGETHNTVVTAVYSNGDKHNVTRFAAY